MGGLQSISQAGTSDIAVEAAEIALDSFLDGELLEKVPVFGWLVKFHNVTVTIRDRIFLKKIANFLYGTRNISEEDQRILLKKTEEDPKKTKKIGESIILLLERQEDFEKALILGKPFSDWLDDKISQSLYSSGLIRSEGYIENIYCANDIGDELLKCLEE